MSEIPEDIMKTAQAHFEKTFFYQDIDTTTCIAMAIKDERERCAGIAEDRSPVFQDMEYEPIQEACADIARAIRSPKL